VRGLVTAFTVLDLSRIQVWESRHYSQKQLALDKDHRQVDGRESGDKSPHSKNEPTSDLQRIFEPRSGNVYFTKAQITIIEHRLVLF